MRRRIPVQSIARYLPAQTTQVSKETYYRGKRDLQCADF
jgi:hypothetical protein